MTDNQMLEKMSDALRECFIDLQNISTRIVGMFTELQRMTLKKVEEKKVSIPEELPPNA